MKAIRNMLVAAAAAATLGACAPAMEQAGQDSVESKTTLVVKNNAWLDMAIYVMRGPARTRVGTVPSMSTERFRISDSQVGAAGEVRIIADPIGGNRTYTSPVINVVPGSEIELNLHNQITISSFAVYQSF